MYPSLITAIRMMYSENGIRTFYKGKFQYKKIKDYFSPGLSPALLLNVPQTGIFFYFYKLFTNVWKICFVSIDSVSTHKSVCVAATEYT